MYGLENSVAIRLLVLGGALSLTSIFQMGYATAYPNTAVDAFREFVNGTFEAMTGHTPSPKMFSWLWSAILNTWFVGFSIGSLVAVPFADRLGRKVGLLVGNTLNAVAAGIALLSVIFPSLLLFAFSRLLFSLAAALSMNSLILLLQECAPASMRGLMSFYAEMAFVVTNLAGGMAGTRALLGTRLPWLIGLSVLVALISVLVVLPFHESPRFLLAKRNDPEAAARALHFYQRIDAQKSDAVQAIGDSVDESNEEKGGIVLVMRTPHYRKGLLLGLACLQVAVSIWPIVFFSTEFLRREGVADDTAEFVSTVMLFLSTLCTIAGMCVVERFPRRLLLLISGGVNVFALALFVVSSQMQVLFPAFRIGCIVAVCLHGTSYSVALGPIAWFIVSELSPVVVRALSQSTALCVNQLIALLLCMITLPLYDHIGSWCLLALFCIPGVLCLFIIYMWLPETRARDIDDVVAELKGRGKTVVSASEIEISMKEDGNRGRKDHL